MLEIVGIAMIARMTEAFTMLRPLGRSKGLCINGATTTMPKKPRTTEGIPARSSIIDFVMSLIEAGAISEMYTALSTPSGTAIRQENTVTTTEPKIRGHIPYAGGS